MGPIIQSILDNDVYKFCTQAFALELFPNTVVQYRFSNRGAQRFNQEFLDKLNYQIQKELPKLRLSDAEYNFLQQNCSYLKRHYLEYLKNFRFQPEQVKISLTEDNNLDIKIDGLWCDTCLWEVPLMALISDIYFTTIDTNWSMYGQEDIARNKAVQLIKNKVKFAEFGTRRRRNVTTQYSVIRSFQDMEYKHSLQNIPCFVGTSNVYFAQIFGLVPIGSIPHEVIMACSILESLNHPNYYAMNNWSRVFGSSLGTMLTDTYGVDSFLKDFNLRFAKLFDSTRWDSGCAFTYTDKIIAHYKKLKIDPMTKTVIFSDNLNVDKAIEIKNYCEGKIKCSFGIGTHFTSDFFNSPALNMVIKLWSVNEQPVCKLSDSPGKVIGDKEMIRIMEYLHKGKPLDQEINQPIRVC